MDDTRGEDYALRLQRKGGTWWKRALNVQWIYQRNLRRQDLGRTIDIGCGIGRNLHHLDPGSVGVDHNEASIRIARASGLTAFTVEEWNESKVRQPEAFDSLILAHVIEHMDAPTGEALLREYLPVLKPGGKVFFICPQERGYASDSTHVRWTTGEDLEELATTVGLVPDPWRSFPFPRMAGRVFTYNEFNVLAYKPV